MFGFLKADPVKKLEKEYSSLMEKAVQAQRNGNIDLYSELSFLSDKILEQIENLKKDKKES